MGRLSPWQPIFWGGLLGDNKVEMCLERGGGLRDDEDGRAQREGDELKILIF